MNPTKHTDPDEAWAAAARHNHNPLVVGIDVGMNLVIRAARSRTAAERRSMYWLTRYSRLLDLTQDALATKLGLSAAQIRDALTNPSADLKAFCRAVEALREAFEAPLRGEPGPAPVALNPFPVRSPWHEAYGRPAQTLTVKRVGSAVRMALSAPELVEVIGLERLGKTVAIRHQFLLNLDRAAFMEAPVSRSELDWERALARAVGVGIGTAMKSSQLRAKTEECLGANKIELLIIDEGHRLIPTDLRKRPDRLEGLRSFLDRFGLSVLLTSTPQFAAMVDEMSRLADEGGSLYRPGQWIGRRQPFDMPETLKDDDLAAIIRWHEPKLGEASVRDLIEYAKASPGYIGSMVKVIKRARNYADGGVIAPADLDSAKKQVAREARMEAIRSQQASKITSIHKGRRAA